MIRNGFSTKDGNASAFQRRAKKLPQEISLADIIARAHRFLVYAGGPPACERPDAALWLMILNGVAHNLCTKRRLHRVPAR
jgi:hypothetical protein